MTGHTSINYCIFINTDKGCYRFAKETIYNDIDGWERSYVHTKSNYVYNTFIKLYPILSLFKRKKLEFVRCWDTFHPEIVGTSYNNNYRKNKDEFYTRLFFDWYHQKLNE